MKRSARAGLLDLGFEFLNEGAAAKWDGREDKEGV